MAGKVGVPGVGMGQIGSGQPGSDLQIDAERAECWVRRGELGGHLVGRHPGLVASGAEAVNVEVDEFP